MRKLMLAAPFLVAFLGAGILSAQDAPAFKVIVNSANPATSMAKKNVSKLFLKKKSKWENGNEVQPVDLEKKSPVRKAFTKDVHGKSVSAIDSYWQKLIFSGRKVPPAALASDKKVIEFVKANADAVGYVSAKAAVEGVKILTITD